MQLLTKRESILCPLLHYVRYLLRQTYILVLEVQETIPEVLQPQERSFSHTQAVRQILDIGRFFQLQLR